MEFEFGYVLVLFGMSGVCVRDYLMLCGWLLVKGWLIEKCLLLVGILGVNVVSLWLVLNVSVWMWWNLRWCDGWCVDV